MAFSFNFDIKAKQDQYCQDDTNAENNPEHCLQTVKDDPSSPPKALKEAREHLMPSDMTALLRDVVTETVCVGALPRLVCVNESVLELTAEERRGEEEEEEEEEVMKKVMSQRSDLLPGVYEGGLRVWECTYDLLTHLSTGGVDFTGRRVLDLGCGAGLLGVMAMRLGAELVDFQDYNSIVIRQLTIANTALNQQGDREEEGEGEEEEEEEEEEGEGEGEEEEGEEEEEKKKKMKKRKEEEEERDGKGKQKVGEKRGKGDQRVKQTEEERREGGREETESPPIKRRACPDSALATPPLTSAPCGCRCRFFSGDWTSFLSLMQQQGGPAHKYDIILTSETIYNTAYYPALHQVLHRLLAHDGQVLLATKAHYFGVGGGILLFEDFLEKRGVFQSRRLLDVQEGLQRHVLSITFKGHNTHTSHTHTSSPNGTAQKTA